MLAAGLKSTVLAVTESCFEGPRGGVAGRVSGLLVVERRREGDERWTPLLHAIQARAGGCSFCPAIGRQGRAGSGHGRWPWAELGGAKNISGGQCQPTP